MNEITSGLTGDSEADIAYLNEQMLKYRDHEMGTEILRACGRLAYDRIPADKKEKFAKILDNQSSGIDATLEEVRFLIFKKDYEKALTMIEDLVKTVETLNVYHDDQVSEYHVFDEYFEELLYQHYYKPEKDLRQAPLPYPKIYLLYGSLLYEMERYLDARSALEKGLKWKLINFKLMSEYMETFKVTNEMEQFFTLSVEAFKIAFHSADVARCYRNLGYYFVDKELYPVAIACYFVSLAYENGQSARAELQYIGSLTNKEIKAPTEQQLRTYTKEYGFPIRADEDVIGFAYALGSHFKKLDKLDAARYFFTIVYDLTDNDNALKSVSSMMS